MTNENNTLAKPMPLLIYKNSKPGFTKPKEVRTKQTVSNSEKPTFEKAEAIVLYIYL